MSCIRRRSVSPPALLSVELVIEPVLLVSRYPRYSSRCKVKLMTCCAEKLTVRTLGCWQQFYCQPSFIPFYDYNSLLNCDAGCMCAVSPKLMLWILFLTLIGEYSRMWMFADMYTSRTTHQPSVSAYKDVVPVHET